MRARKKASGISLIQELRKGGLPVKAMLPDRSKKSRAHAAEIPFEQGCVWYMDRNWAQSVIRECAQFPNGEYDDFMDTVTQAIIWLRKTYHLEFRDEDWPHQQRSDNARHGTLRPGDFCLILLRFCEARPMRLIKYLSIQLVM